MALLVEAISRFAPATATTPGAAYPMQDLLTYLAGHAHQLLTSLTPEQTAALVSSCCATGSLLLQYLSYRRGKQEQ